jgi:hypothetical protein
MSPNPIEIIHILFSRLSNPCDPFYDGMLVAYRIDRAAKTLIGINHEIIVTLYPINE